MKIQVNTDDHGHGGESPAERVSEIVQAELERFKSYITRIEIHLSDENGAKGGQGDKRCMIEARLEGRKPVAVTEYAESMKLAVQGATHKLTRMLDSMLGRLHDHRKGLSSVVPVPETDLPP